MKAVRYDSLDAMRGFAALMVVLHHCFRAFEDTSQGLLWWLDKTPLRLLVSGRPAVILFFVLSGFVLAVSLEKGMKYRDFIARRFCRIYLPFAASIVMAAAIYIAVEPSKLAGYSAWVYQSEPLSWELLAGHLLMLGDYSNVSLNKVMWSLVYELRISLVFPMIMWLTYRYPTWRVIAASLIAAVAAYASLRHLGYGPREFHYSTSSAASFWLTVHFSLYFVMGAALAKHRDQLIGLGRDVSPAQRFMLLVASSALLLAMSLVITDIALGILSAIMIVLVLAGGATTKAIFESRPAAFLGRISFSLYLVHLPIFYFAAQMWPGGAMPMAYIWFVWPLLAICAGTIAYRYIEQPSQQLGRALVTRLNSVPGTTATTAG